MNTASTQPAHTTVTRTFSWRESTCTIMRPQVGTPPHRQTFCLFLIWLTEAYISHNFYEAFGNVNHTYCRDGQHYFSVFYLFCKHNYCVIFQSGRLLLSDPFKLSPPYLTQSMKTQISGDVSESNVQNQQPVGNLLMTCFAIVVKAFTSLKIESWDISILYCFN